MALELNNENIDSIKQQIRETEIEISHLTEKIKANEEAKNKLTSEYQDKKADYEEYKRAYAEQSTYGIYFLVVSLIAFIAVTYKVLDHSLVSFMMIPASILLIAGIAGKIIGDNKFQKMKSVMNDKEMEYSEIKTKYDDFMSFYNADVRNLEKKQYEWELVENDMIEAKKDAWIAQQKNKNKEA